MFGYKLSEGIGKLHFWLLTIGFHMTFLIQHWLGVAGAPRRYVNYLAEDGFDWMNQISTVGAFIMGVSTLPFPPQRGPDPPEGEGRGRRSVGLRRLARVGDVLPAAAPQLPLAPRVRSRRPAFDLHHPEVALQDHMLTEEPARTEDELT